MLENIKWDDVFHSIVDTWPPLFGLIDAIIVIAMVGHIIKKNGKIKISELVKGQ